MDVVSSWSETLDIGDAHDKIEISCYNNGIAEILLKRKEALPFAKMKIIVPEHVNLAIRAARLFLRTTNKVFPDPNAPTTSAIIISVICYQIQGDIDIRATAGVVEINGKLRGESIRIEGAGE